MRKIIYLITAILLTTVAVSCNSDNTPTAVADKSVKCLQKGDYEAYSKLMYYDDTLSSNELKTQQETTAALLKGKYEESVKDKGKITGYRMLSEEVADSNAVVKMRIGYEKADSADESISLRLNHDGKWRLTLSK